MAAPFMRLGESSGANTSGKMSSQNTSGQWETVGKPKKSNGGKSNKPTKNEKKKFEERAPKIEDVLPMGQVSQMSSAAFDLQADPGSPKKEKKTNSPAKTKKVNNDKREDKGDSNKKPMTVEEAVSKVSVQDLKAVLTNVKSLYPDNQVLWLRDAATYLNLALSVAPTSTSQQDLAANVFCDKPLSLLTKETKRTLTQLMEQCGDGARQTGFETFLANMAHDLQKGNPVIGNMVMLQLMADVYPSLCCYNTARYMELRTSYQNRPKIGLSILWAVGQGGRKDLGTGLKVWLDMMLPVMTMKHYSKFVVDYLSSLISHHSKIKSGPRVLYPHQFFQFFDAIFVQGPNALHKDVQAQLAKNYPKIKELGIGDCSVDHDLFPEFLRRLSDVPAASVSLRNELLACLTQCLVNNEASVVHWQQMYITHLPGSAQLLSHLVRVWKSVSAKLMTADFFATLEAFQEYNESTPIQKDGIEQCTKSCEYLLTKMSTGSGSGWFPWKTATLLFLIGIATVVNQDVHEKGSFKASRTGVFLRDVGLFDHTVTAYNVTFTSYLATRSWVEKNGPVYYKHVEAYAGPAIAKTKEWSVKAYNYVAETGPVVVDKVNEYLPGMKEKFFIYSEAAWVHLKRICIWIADTSLIYGDIVLKYMQNSFYAVKQCINDIIDGKIDLADVSNSAKLAFQKSKNYAADLYQWLQKQIDVMIK